MTRATTCGTSLKATKDIDSGISHAQSGTPGQSFTPLASSFANISKKSYLDYLGRSDEPSHAPPAQAKRKGIRIPVLGDVAAGIPIDAVQDILDYADIDEEMASTGEFFGLRIRGRSMEPRMVEGDVVIVRRRDAAADEPEL